MRDLRELSSLVASVCCPRCGRNSGRMEAEAYRGILTCYRRDCLQHWWVMWLDAGAVEPQLAAVFGEEHARINMVVWRLPNTLLVGAYWQLRLSRNVYEEHRSSGSPRLLSALVELFRSRSSLVPSKTIP